MWAEMKALFDLSSCRLTVLTEANPEGRKTRRMCAVTHERCAGMSTAPTVNA